MGACYSKSGQDVMTDREKRPRERKKNSQKNGHTGSFKTDRLVLDIPIQKDLSDTVYTEDSHFVVTDVTNCINKSQQTSLDRLTRDANKNIENLTGCEVIEQNDLVVISDTNVNTKDHSRDTENDQKGVGVMSRHLETTDGKVSTSDSGIVVETCKGCENIEPNLDGKDEYSESFETHLNSLENETNHTGVNEQEIIQRSCACSNSKICDSQRQRIHTDHSNTNSCHGECQGHLFSKSSRPFHVNNSSESLILKSSLKKGSGKTRRKKGLSWKSADSLDWVESMAISLDRTKSVCSSILGDDISLLNAPLAAFDSVDYALGSSYDFSKRLGGSMRNNVDYCSDTFQFQFDFSGLEGENRQSVASLDRLSESNKTSESTTDLDKIRLAIRQNSLGTPTEQR